MTLNQHSIQHSQNTSLKLQSTLPLYKVLVATFCALFALFAVCGCSCSQQTTNSENSSQASSTSQSSDSADNSQQSTNKQSAASSSTSNEEGSSDASSSDSDQKVDAVATGISSGNSTTSVSERPSGVSESLWQTLCEYEQTMTQYYEFLKQYNANPNDEDLISQAKDWNSKVQSLREKFAAIDQNSLNDDEKLYYKEINNRINLKMDQLGKSES